MSPCVAGSFDGKNIFKGWVFQLAMLDYWRAAGQLVKTFKMLLFHTAQKMGSLIRNPQWRFCSDLNEGKSGFYKPPLAASFQSHGSPLATWFTCQSIGIASKLCCDNPYQTCVGLHLLILPSHIHTNYPGKRIYYTVEDDVI